MFARVGGRFGKKFCQFLTGKNGGKNLKCAQKIISSACCLRSVSAHSRSAWVARPLRLRAKAFFFFVFVFLFSQVGGLVDSRIDERMSSVVCNLFLNYWCLYVMYVCLGRSTTWSVAHAFGLRSPTRLSRVQTLALTTTNVRPAAG